MCRGSESRFLECSKWCRRTVEVLKVDFDCRMWFRRSVLTARKGVGGLQMFVESFSTAAKRIVDMQKFGESVFDCHKGCKEDCRSLESRFSLP